MRLDNEVSSNNTGISNCSCNDDRDNCDCSVLSGKNKTGDSRREHETEELSLVKPLKYGDLKEQIAKLQERFERRKNDIKNGRLLPG